MTQRHERLEIWFIRHGQTDWNLEGRIQGASDRDLNETGKRQAALLRQRLHGLTFDAVWSSDLRRARQTAEIAFPDSAIRLDERLREMHAGVHEGMLFKELPAEAAALRAAVRAGDATLAPAGGESYRDVIARIRGWLADLPQSGRIASVVHGGVVHAAVRLALGQQAGWPDGAQLSTANTSITELHVAASGLTLVRLNDHAHLEGTEFMASSDAAQPRVKHVADGVA